MFELSVGSDVKFSFSAGDMRSAGCGLSDVVGRLCELGISGGVGLSAFDSASFTRVLGQHGDVGSGVSGVVGEGVERRVDESAICSDERDGGGGRGARFIAGLLGSRGSCERLEGSERSAAPVLHAGGDSGGVELRSGSANGSSEVAKPETLCGGGVSVSGEESAVPFGPRGRHWARNKRRQEIKRKKTKEEKKKNSPVVVDGSLGPEIPEWRRKSVERVGDFDGRRGFFSECSEEVKAELRESRARLLIEENKRKLAQEQAKLRALDVNSPECLARQFLQAAALAGRMRAVKDEKVGSWAGAVAESLVHTVASSAPSTVPSLDSIGLGSSTAGDVVVKSERVMLYEAEVKLIKLHYDGLDSYQPSDYAYDLGKLREKYADVVYDAETARRVADKVAVERFLMSGIAADRMGELLVAFRSEYADIFELTNDEL